MSNLSTVYDDDLDGAVAPSVSLVERALLSSLLEELGPDAPTLCEGWDAHHLAAHLTIREGSNPLKSLLVPVPKAGDWLVDRRVATKPFEVLVEQVRSGPGALSLYSVAKLEPALNLLEFFVHHEDLRRAQPGWSARVLPRWAEDQIWDRLRGAAKLLLRGTPGPVTLQRSDAPDSVTASKGSTPITLTGLPSELALHVMGRASVADVEQSPAATSEPDSDG